MGKIFDALEKFRKDSGGSISEKIKNSDYETLMQFDEATGKIDIHDPNLNADSRTLRRLMTYRLIDSDGTLTPAGMAKYDELRHRYGKMKPEPRTAPDLKKEEAVSEATAKKFEKLTASDWSVLIKYDRKTGNLLKYDADASQLDENSKAVLKDPAIIQRLIDANMILPGGWLTPEAKQECLRMEQKLQRQIRADHRSEEPPITAEKLDAGDAADKLNEADLKALLLYDPQTGKLDFQHPMILKDPAIIKRLLDSGMIEADGKLTPKALVRYRFLTRWAARPGEKGPAALKQKRSLRKRSQTVADHKPAPEAADKANRKRLKVIPVKKDRQKALKKHDILIPEIEAPFTEPVKAAADSRFTIGKSPARYDQNAIDKNLISFLEPQSFEAEQFKILRTNLLFPTADKAPRSIMVTSSVPGEGKSFVAANLAVSVARHMNWNVLLMDCDLRRPSIHSQFGFRDVPGLSDYLANGVALPSLMLRTAQERLTILPGGRPPSNPSELLSSERMSAMIKEVVKRYDDRLIIMDSPPPKLTAETGALARQVDGIVLVVKYGSTPRDTVTELINKLGKDKILGAIVNNFDAGSSRYHKKYYGGNYYGIRK